MIELKTDAEFVNYQLDVGLEKVSSKMPASVALEILQRSEVDYVDGRFVTGGMSFSGDDFEER